MYQPKLVSMRFTDFARTTRCAVPWLAAALVTSVGLLQGSTAVAQGELWVAGTGFWNGQSFVSQEPLSNAFSKLFDMTFDDNGRWMLIGELANGDGVGVQHQDIPQPLVLPNADPANQNSDSGIYFVLDAAAGKFVVAAKVTNVTDSDGRCCLLDTVSVAVGTMENNTLSLVSQEVVPATDMDSGRPFEIPSVSFADMPLRSIDVAMTEAGKWELAFLETRNEFANAKQSDPIRYFSNLVRATEDGVRQIVQAREHVDYDMGAELFYPVSITIGTSTFIGYIEYLWDQTSGDTTLMRVNEQTIASVDGSGGGRNIALDTGADGRWVAAYLDNAANQIFAHEQNGTAIVMPGAPQPDFIAVQPPNHEIHVIQSPDPDNIPSGLFVARKPAVVRVVMAQTDNAGPTTGITGTMTVYRASDDSVVAEIGEIAPTPTSISIDDKINGKDFRILSNSLNFYVVDKARHLAPDTYYFEAQITANGTSLGTVRTEDRTFVATKFSGDTNPFRIAYLPIIVNNESHPQGPVFLDQQAWKEKTVELGFTTSRILETMLPFEFDSVETAFVSPVPILDFFDNPIDLKSVPGSVAFKFYVANLWVRQKLSSHDFVFGFIPGPNELPPEGGIEDLVVLGVEHPNFNTAAVSINTYDIPATPLSSSLSSFFGESATFAPQHEICHAFGIRHAGEEGIRDTRVGDRSFYINTNDPGTSVHMGHQGRSWLMTEGGTFFARWISAHNYERLRTTDFSSSKSQPHAGSAGSYLLLSGVIDVVTEEVNVMSSQLVSEESGVSEPAPGPFELVVFDNSDTVLFRHQFSSTGLIDEAPVKNVPFGLFVPWPAGGDKIIIEHNGSPIYSDQISPASPTVTLSFPIGGETLAGLETVTWIAEDADGDGLSASLYYSSDGGATFDALVPAVAGNSAELNFEDLAGTTEGVLRVDVSDGFNVGTAQSAPFIVGNKAPTAAILSPSDGDVFSTSLSFFVSGAAFDREDGELGAASLVWSSSVQGALGTGSRLQLTALSAGTHELSLTATDSLGLENTTTVQVRVLPDSDGDGLPDDYETANGLNPNVDDAQSDPDGDGLTNQEEHSLQTDPQLSDTDGDSISDGQEVIDGTDPGNPDSDFDGVSDDLDVCPGADDTRDEDGDGIPTGCDNCPSTYNPAQADSDSDGFGDACENGGKIIASRTIGFLEAGTRLTLKAPLGNNYQWEKDGVLLQDSPLRLTGVNAKSLVFAPLVLEDSGVYRVRYDDGQTKKIIYSNALHITVLPVGSLPLAFWPLAALILALAAATTVHRFRAKP